MINSRIVVLLLNLCYVWGNTTSNTCTQRDISTAYLDAAIDVITRAKYHMPSDSNCTDCPNGCPECPIKVCPECPKFPNAKAIDCGDLLKMGHSSSGIYQVWPRNRMTEGKPIKVYCDMDTDGGGWTVIQRRGDFGSPRDYFYQAWTSYKEGFGALEKDFWLGNDKIFVLTNEKYYSVRFDLMDMNKNRRYAHYNDFWIDNEDCKYTLHISNYTGDAGDEMSYNNNRAFTTKDRDNDRWYGNCAVYKKGAWWYNECSRVNLNGLYFRDQIRGREDGIYWIISKGLLEWTEIKIRPKNFQP